MEPRSLDHLHRGLLVLVAPTLVLAALAPGAPSLDHLAVYLLALGATSLFDFTWVATRARLLHKRRPIDTFRVWFGMGRVSAILCMVGFFPALAAADEPVVLLTIGPLVWLLTVFSRDRSER